MSEIRDRISSVASLRLRAGWNEAVLGRLRINPFGKQRLLDAFARIRDTASLLGPAGRGAARLVMERALATPRRVAIGAGAAALVAGIGASALLVQHGRHAALVASATGDPSPASASAAPPAGTVDPAATQAAPAPSTAPAAQPPAAGQAPAGQAAPDVTASIGPPAQDKPHPSSAPPAPDSGQRTATLAPDPIGALLRGKRVDDGSHLVRAAQIALLKLGYAVKPDGAEDRATRRALRRFEHAHGLAPTTEINAELVKQLTAAAP
jgi:peptidoglycan hydrolase-like protein with peptidoglycan-binding domain